MIRKLLLGFVVVVVICFAAYLRFRHPKTPLDVAYVGNHQVIVWDTSAEVREQSGTLNYGDRVDILTRLREQVQVHAKSGVTGWVDQGDLIPADIWQKAQNLEARANKLPVEVQGSTRVLGNLHLDADRESPRLRQLNKGIPVDMFERQTVDIPGAAASAAAPAPPAHGDEEETASEPAGARKKEDWWLVRAHLPDQTTSTGWILSRFVSINVPLPLPDYASSAGFHVAAWFVLNQVADSSGNAKPQYLVLGTKGPEGQPCDFTLLRVYTWGNQKQRYETAFVDSNLCGKFPVQLTHPAVSGDSAFSFEDWSAGASEQRAYTMHQTAVRRVGKPGAGKPASKFMKQSHPVKRKAKRG